MSQKQMPPQHIICLEIENYKRISAFKAEFDPNKLGGVVILSGENEAGKSTVLDSIRMAMTGSVDSEPLRRGENKGKVLLKTNDFVFTYRFTQKGAYFELSNVEGAVFKSPRALLEGFYSAVSFDPLAFSERLKPAEQAAELLRVCPVEIDLDANAAEAKRLYDERTIANREVNRIEAVLKSLPEAPTETPETVSVTELTEKLEALREQERGHQEKRQLLKDAEGQVQVFTSDIQRAEREIAEWEKKLRTAKSNLQEAKKFLGVSRESVEELTKVVAQITDLKPEADALKAKIADAEQINARSEKVRQDIAKRSEASAQLFHVRQKASDLDIDLTKTQKERAEALRTAKFPVEGLEINEGGFVRLNNLPLEQASTAQKIKLGVKLARAASPTMRIVLIRDGSLLDAKSMATLNEEAEAHGLQVWIERLEEDKGAIKIVDGTNLTQAELKGVEE